MSAPRIARFTLLGVGAMRSPRYAPAGLLVSAGGERVAIDGGPGAEPPERLDAWLVCDERAELRRELRRLAAERGLEPRIGRFRGERLSIEPRAVVHTSHPTVGYRIVVGGQLVVWAPEFLEPPAWARGAALFLAEAAGWNRRILFARGAGGHASALEVARAAERLGVRRLVFAHIGRPTIRAADAGAAPPFGELGHDGDVFALHADGSTRRSRRRS